MFLSHCWNRLPPVTASIRRYCFHNKLVGLLKVEYIIHGHLGKKSGDIQSRVKDC